MYYNITVKAMSFINKSMAWGQVWWEPKVSDLSSAVLLRWTLKQVFEIFKVFLAMVSTVGLLVTWLMLCKY